MWCTGSAFAVLAAMYSSASSRVRVGSALSPDFAVRRGVAQGCPLSPLLYAIFVDPVLRDICICMQVLSHPDMLWVGPAATRRKLVGQAYADDLAGIAATQHGLQRVVHAVHLHSLRWGWRLNVPKSIVMVFGTQSLCAGLGAPELCWGDSRLPTADTVKYLGLRLESNGGWAAQQAAGAANGWAALHRWLPVLRRRHLSAATKLLVLRSRIASCMSYGMELWRPSKRGANMTAVLVRAAKLISGVYRDASHTAFFKDRSVNQDVMLADLDVLSADDHCPWHMPASMLGKQMPRPLLHCTHAMTRARLSLTPSCLLHMHRITWELLFGVVCTPGMAGSASRARAMTRPYDTAFALRLH